MHEPRRALLCERSGKGGGGEWRRLRAGPDLAGWTLKAAFPYRSRRRFCAFYAQSHAGSREDANLSTGQSSQSDSENHTVGLVQKEHELPHDQGLQMHWRPLEKGICRSVSVTA